MRNQRRVVERVDWRWAERCPCCGMLPDDPDRDPAQCEAARTERLRLAQLAREEAENRKQNAERAREESLRKAEEQREKFAAASPFVAGAAKAVLSRCLLTVEQRLELDLERAPDSVSDADFAMALYERTGELLPKTSIRRRRAQARRKQSSPSSPGPSGKMQKGR